MDVFPRLFSSDKSNEIYSSYKYIDIKPEWIIHEGYLEYLYGENIFKSSLCKFRSKKEGNLSLFVF
jgi:ribosome biogenesis protein Nip4